MEPGLRDRENRRQSYGQAGGGQAAMEPGLRDRENAYRATRITGHVAAAMEPGLGDRENPGAVRRRRGGHGAAMEPGLRDRENAPRALPGAAGPGGRNGARPERPGKRAPGLRQRLARGKPQWSPA